jgi:hypothetical protein
MLFQVEGRFTAVVEADNGEEVQKIMEGISKPNNVEILTIEVEEFWEYVKYKEELWNLNQKK